jgi:hypothetical protein
MGQRRGRTTAQEAEKIAVVESACSERKYLFPKLEQTHEVGSAGNSPLPGLIRLGILCSRTA